MTRRVRIIDALTGEEKSRRATSDELTLEQQVQDELARDKAQMDKVLAREHFLTVLHEAFLQSGDEREFLGNVWALMRRDER